MKVSLIQVDGKIPNLALMKLATYHQKKGDEVIVGEDPEADLHFISMIFKGSKKRYLELRNRYPFAIVGGVGISSSISLLNSIEHLMPAYDLWDINYSMGYLTRGCIRNCEFCIVPGKEGPIMKNADLDEFLHPDHSRVILMDNNLLAHREAESILLDLESRDLEVNFIQGLDIRLVSEGLAKALAPIKSRTYGFSNRKTYHFALDSVDYEKQFIRGMDYLMAAGIKGYMITVYVLVDFDTTIEEDLKRIELIKSYNADPYVMVYNKTSREPSKVATNLQRWANAHIHRRVAFDDYNSSIRGHFKD